MTIPISVMLVATIAIPILSITIASTITAIGIGGGSIAIQKIGRSFIPRISSGHLYGLPTFIKQLLVVKVDSADGIRNVNVGAIAGIFQGHHDL